MKVTCTVILGLALLQGAAFAQTTPEIQVIDGKVSMAVQGMSLSRVLSLVDRAMGLTSTVKPELANRNISVRFTNLGLKDAVRKIFEGQPYNYILIEGKGIRVTDLAGGTTSSASSSPFQDSGPISQPLPTASPLQPANAVPINAVPINAVGQPTPTTPFGTPTNPLPVPTPSTGNTGPAPGQLPPPIGANNPLVNPAGAQPPVGAGGFPTTASPPPTQPAGPGTIPGAAPGTIGR